MYNIFVKIDMELNNLLYRLIKNYFITFKNQQLDIQITFVFSRSFLYSLLYACIFFY